MTAEEMITGLMARTVSARQCDVLDLRYSCRVSGPPSRPRREVFTPPKGAAASFTSPRLIPTIPLSSPQHPAPSRRSSLKT